MTEVIESKDSLVGGRTRANRIYQADSQRMEMIEDGVVDLVICSSTNRFGEISGPYPSGISQPLTALPSASLPLNSIPRLRNAMASSLRAQASCSQIPPSRRGLQFFVSAQAITSSSVSMASCLLHSVF
jgi:hypothetical protein